MSVYEADDRYFPQYSEGHYPMNRIGGVMVTMPAVSAIDRGFEPRSLQAKNYKIGVCFLCAKHAALRRKRKDWLARNQENVSE